jgi:small-conductance mechanosensitive channel
MERLIAIAIGVFFILMVNFFIRRALVKSIKDTDNRYKARKAVNMLAYLLMVMVVLFVYSDKLGNIGIALGVAGAGIAFALQEVIVSLAGWINIMITGNVRVGDRVKIGEVKGDIIDIAMMSITIMEIGDWVNGDLYNGRIVTVANSFVFKEKLHNYSHEYPFLWDEIRVPIRTESDYATARSVFERVLKEVCGDYAEQSKQQWLRLANKYRVEEAQVEPMVTLEFDENWILFTLRFVVDFKKRRTTKDLIFTRLLEEIEKTEGKIVIACTTIEVSSGN